MHTFDVVIDDNLHLLVIPDSEAHLNGHVIITYSYSLYKSSRLDITKENNLHLEKNDDPDFMGTIIFEEPERLFKYESGSHNSLTSDEIEEAIEKITYYRNTPSLWRMEEGS